MTNADRKASAQALADRLAEDLAMLRATKGVPPALLAHKISEAELVIHALAAFAACETTPPAPALAPQPSGNSGELPAPMQVVPERALAEDILAELVRARAKFPGKNVTFAALVEEVGELATATFEEGRDRVLKEAVQVAVMAMRMVLDGDHTFDAWRLSKGLDALVTEPNQ